MHRPEIRALRQCPCATRDKDLRRRFLPRGPNADHAPHPRPASSAWCVPRTRASAAVIVNRRSTNSGLKVAARPIGCGKARRVDGGAGHAGILRERLPECRAGFLKKEFLNVVGQFCGGASIPPPAASLGLPTWPRPWPCLKCLRAFCRSNFPAASISVSAFCCQTHIICAAFLRASFVRADP